MGPGLRHANRLTTGWTLSGTTRFSTGLPVTLYDDSDNSLLGTLGNQLLTGYAGIQWGTAGHQHKSQESKT